MGVDISPLALLELYAPKLYEELYLLDKAGDGIFFGDPTHTISYNIAKRAEKGDPLAIELCKALNALSPDHCKNAIINEGG